MTVRLAIESTTKKASLAVDSNEITSVPNIADALKHLKQAISENPFQDVDIILAPGVHPLASTAVLDHTNLPAAGYHCRWRSAVPNNPATIRSSCAVTG